jgi:hypothetical protein
MDVLKQVEEALGGILWFLDAGTQESSMAPRCCAVCGMVQRDDKHEHHASCNAVQITAALTALRGLEWKPIAEMAKTEPVVCIVGGYQHGSQFETASFYSGLFAAECGYTHFCRPILPTPPKREVENAG